MNRHARIITALILAAACFAAVTAGTPFTKPVKKSRRPAKDVAASATTAARDTVMNPSPDSVAVAGYEKTLRSARESMYVTNRTSGGMSALGLEITYFDMDGRMLHKAVHDMAVDIPAGETRLIDVPSFDRQALYYYHLSPVPSRASRATPFSVKVNVTYIIP